METQQVDSEGYAVEENVTYNLGDIPDLTGVVDDGPTEWADGWYGGAIVGRREFTDKNGNDRIFESTDSVSQKGDSRNIRLQVALKRQSDGREMNLSTLINYQPDDLTQETVQKVTVQKEKNKASGENEWGSLARSHMSLVRLGKLQKIAGVRQLQRNGDGGLNITPLFGKTGFFKVAPDDRNPQYKQITDFRETKPTKVPVL